MTNQIVAGRSVKQKRSHEPSEYYLSDMNETEDLSLIQLLHIWRRWWATLLIFPLIATALTLGIALLLPKQYYAATTVLPVNSMLTDRARLFGEHIEQLYSNFGNSDDLDRLYTIATAGNVLGFITDSLGLIQHYQSRGTGEQARSRAIKTLKSNLTILKTPNGALEIAAWDKNPNTAAAIANLVVYRAEWLYRQLNDTLNQRLMNALQDDLGQKREQLRGSASDSIPSVRTTTLQAERTALLLHELRLSSNTRQPPLLVLEKAHPAATAGKPNLPVIAIITLVLSLFFTALTTLVIERKRIHDNTPAIV
jgi:uncharacterized protein involved in exopolysaccharide biosynthesis